MATQPSLFAQALAYAEHGVRVFPCMPGEKRPHSPHGYLDATTDPYRIRTWWTAHPTANIATPTGAPGFDALDVDVRSNGDGWQAVRRLHEVGLLEGWVRAVSTPSGGMHLHYPGTEQRNASLRGIHLDFRILGGYVLLPPSSITTPEYSGTYKLLEGRPGPGRPLDWAEVLRVLAPRPNSLLRTPPPGLGSVAWLAAHVARQAEGNRDNALFWAACRAVEAGATDLERLVQAAVTTGLPENQARRTVRSAEATIARGARAVAPSSTETPDIPTRSAS